MRPIRLTVSAFGPYAEKTVLPLDLLGDRGIYLITGDTGAGKTTIFDAIAYALFAEASGSVRDGTMLRSKNASPTVKTEVELEFIYKEKRYTVKRSPEYTRPKSKGEGVTKERASAELIYPDGRVLTGMKEVTAAIVSLLGVDRGQFTQIAMIAQGDFQKLLLASTDERKRIFQRIFDTQNYFLLGERLKSDSLSLMRECDALDASRRQYLSGIVFDDEQKESEEARLCHKGELPIEDATELISSLIEKDERAYLECERELAALDKKQRTLDEKIASANAYFSAMDSLEHANATLEKLRTERKTLLDDCDKAKEKESETQTLSDKIRATQALLADYDALTEKRTELKQNESLVSECDAVIAEAMAERTRLDERLKEYETNLSELASIEKNVALLKVELDNKAQRLAEYNDIICELEQLAQAEQQLYIMTEDYMREAGRAERLSREYDAKNRAYLDSQAGLLAMTLKEGEPCPVCGSLSHPTLAKSPDGVPDRQSLEAAAEQLERSRQQMSEKSQALGKRRGMLEEKKTSLLTKAGELFSDIQLKPDSMIDAIAKGELQPRVALAKEDLSEEYGKQAAELSRLEERLKAASELAAAVPTLKDKLTELSSLIESEKIKRASVEALICETKKNIISLNEKLIYNSKEEAVNVIEDLQNKLNSIQNEIKRVKAALDFCDNEISRYEGIAEQASNTARASEAIDIDSVRDESLLLKEKRSCLDELKMKIFSRLSTNRTFLKNIGTLEEELRTLDEKRSLVKRLSDTANGMLSGKEKVSLEAYVQAKFFDRIIDRANTRLMIMTSGQYELVRRTEAQSNRSQSGLELDVVDHFSATVRSVRTLSGGESFMASLSLALGLSDEIQSRSGGIQLDTMFVDEGFGSLDADSLDAAMRALLSLGDGGRLVGIISHVSELKDRIEKQLVVTKNKNGVSSVKIIC